MSAAPARLRPLVAVLGGGQLGRMLALAGHPLGLDVRCLDPSSGACAGQVGGLVVGDYDDPDALRDLAAGAAAVTYEFENVPARAAELAARHAPLAPGAHVLAVAQDRLAEKELARRLGLGTPEFAPLDDLDGLDAALGATGLPAVIKTRRLGYDGKGQRVVRTREEAQAALAELGSGLIVEALVPFARELSLLCVRGLDGTTARYPLVENVHRDGILRTSRAPAPGVSAALDEAAGGIATALLEHLGYVGVLAVELFEVDGRLLVNELAPRVHNSGHWTIDGAATSQFENHLRAVLGLPLGPTHALGHAGMANLIGGWPAPAELLAAVPGAALHLYGKEPRAGRKVGHVNVRADTPEERDELLARLAALADAAG